MSTTLGNQYQNTYISGADFEPTGISLPVGSTAVTPTTGDNSSKIATTAFVNTLQTVISNLTYSQINGKPTTLAGYGITDAQPLNGDLTAITQVPTTGGLLRKLSANSWILDTNPYLTSNQNITISGDINGSGATSITLTLPATGVAAGTYKSVQVNTKGLVVAGANPTTLAGYGITDAPNVSGVGATGTWAISISGNAATATTATTANATATGNNFQMNSLGVGTAPTGTAGQIRTTGDIVAFYSDDRLKTNLGNIQNALDKLKTLSGFYYEANETAQALGYDVIRDVGVSAQSVQAVLPEIVAPAPIDDQYLTVKYDRLAPLIIEAIKELSDKLDAINTDVAYIQLQIDGITGSK